MFARPAVLAGAALAMAGMALSIAATGSLLPAWPAPPPTVVGRWLIDAATAVPLGDAAFRSGLASALAAIIAAGITAATNASRGHGAIVSAAATLAVGIVSFGEQLGGARLPDAVAAMLVAAASRAAFGFPVDSDRRSEPSASAPAIATTFRGLVLPLSLAFVVCAGVVDTSAFVLLPMLIAVGLRRDSAAWVIGGAAAMVGVAVAMGVLPPAPVTSSVSAIGHSWLWPMTLLMCSGLAGAVWGARSSWSVGAASLASLLVYAGGAGGSSMLVIPCLLLADGITALPRAGSRTRHALAVTVVAVSLAEASLWPRVDTWRLLDWRDAVERALPADTRIAASDAAVAALSAPLFGGRASRITISDAPASRDAARFVLRPGTTAAAGRVSSSATTVIGAAAASTTEDVSADPLVHLSYADLPGVLAHMPAGTVVGIVARLDSDAERDRVRAALARLGHQLPAGASSIAAAGVIGGQGVDGLLQASGALHVLIGDRVSAAGQRSASDFALRLTDGGVELFARGRSVAVGPRAGVVAFRPGGPQIVAVTDVQEGAAWPVAFRGLDLRYASQ